MNIKTIKKIFENIEEIVKAEIKTTTIHSLHGDDDHGQNGVHFHLETISTKNNQQSKKNNFTIRLWKHIIAMYGCNGDNNKETKMNQ